MTLDSAGPVENPRDGCEPHPWEQQPGEPPDLYGWFQVYLTLPLPRRLVHVARIANMNQGASWLSKIARQWRWVERAEALDAERTQRLAVQSEPRNRLLRDVAFKAHYQGLHVTGRALDNAALGEMDRDESRRYLSALFQHQRGLLRLIARQNEQSGEIEFDEEWLQELVDARAQQIHTEWAQSLGQRFDAIRKAMAAKEAANGAQAGKQEEIHE
ncbi:MAG: hypothetical protein OXF76_15745 [Caldilineaceae bacterium]|nr:hypothetical protein [Caldilineaceae bacterium]